MEEGREAVEPQMESAQDALLPAHQPPLGDGSESAQQPTDGAVSVIHRDLSQRGTNGLWWCALCTKRIESKQPDRPYGGGRAHQSCIKALNRRAVTTPTPVARTKRPYDTLQPTQQWKRRTEARAAVSAVLQQPSAAFLLYTFHANKRSFNTPFIAVGGDSGGGHTKLGVTYSFKGMQHFAALLVYEGRDGWEELDGLTAADHTPFTGDSAAFPHIFAVLQHFIDTRAALLNGDWPFLCALLGLKGASASHPCPICTVFHKGLLLKKPLRKAGDTHSVHPDHPALLRVDATRIVPTPLHLYLGINNRIILDVYAELLGEQHVREAVQRVKSVHSAGCGGLADVHELNGPEIARWIKKGSCASVLDAAAAISDVSAATKAKLERLSRWMRTLHDRLLHDRDWKETDLFVFRSFLDDIYNNWRRTTAHQPFPKLHMLRHAVEFAERHRFLGRASEAQIESFHAQFNTLFHDHHLNQGSNTTERLRRSLADTSLRAVQPFVQQ